MNNCILCKDEGGHLVWRGDDARVVLIDSPDLPGYCRVIWNRHIAEMSELSEKFYWLWSMWLSLLCVVLCDPKK
jgi:diadenosine tetraphosphate (Ap4A) HIT family hydrolase